MADNSAEPTSAFDGVTVAAVPPAVIRDTDVLVLPRFFLMVALKENLTNLQKNADREHLEGFWDKLIEILKEIRQAVSKIEGGSELEDGILRAKDVVDTKLVPYLQSLPNVDRMLDSYLPQKGQTWEDFLQGKPEHERKLAMAELDIQDFQNHLPDIVLLYMDQFLKDMIEFRRFIARPELLPTDAGDRSPDITPYSICPELLPTNAGDRLPDITPYSICPELLPTDAGERLPLAPHSISYGLSISSFLEVKSVKRVKEATSVKIVKEIKSAKKVTIDKEYYTVVKVYYATDRKLEEGEYKYDDLPLFDWQFPARNAGKSTAVSVPKDVALPPLRPLEYGIVGVSIPSSHKRGEVESPGHLWEKKPDPYKHVMILPKYDQKLRRDEEKFFTILNEDITGNHGLNTKGDLLIFIHGYNNTHDDALKHAAQLKFDMDFKGAMVAYTWSSAGNHFRYYHDEVAIENTVQSLKGFLLAIMAKMKVPTRIHLLAHSMGNRAMIKALDLLHDENQIPKLPNPRCPIATVICAAGDDRPVHWKDLLAKMKKVYPPNAEGKSASRPLLNVYSSSEDWALKFSHALHMEFRLGETNRLFKRSKGALILTPDDYDAIDATGMDTKPLTTGGHGYFGDTPKVIEDIHALITKSIHANGLGLLNVQKSGFKFFAFIRSKWSKLSNLPDSLISEALN